MTVQFKINTNIYGKSAVSLIEKLNENTKKNIFIVKKDNRFNAKSLLSLLTNNIGLNDEILIEVQDADDLNVVKQIFQNYGEEI